MENNVRRDRNKHCCPIGIKTQMWVVARRMKKIQGPSAAAWPRGATVSSRLLCACRSRNTVGSTRKSESEGYMSCVYLSLA